MQSILKAASRASLLAAYALAGGCGSGGPEMGRVSGKVTFNGNPIEKGTITFIATDGVRPNATSNIFDGAYALQTVEPGDGAVVGAYNIAISDIDAEIYNTPLPGMPVKPPKTAFPKKYLDSSASGLTYTVEPGWQSKDFDIVDDGASSAQRAAKK